MKTQICKVNWHDLDDILEKYQDILLKEHLVLDEKQEHLWRISQEIRELCLDSSLESEIIIMENPF